MDDDRHLLDEKMEIAQDDHTSISQKAAFGQLVRSSIQLGEVLSNDSSTNHRQQVANQ